MDRHWMQIREAALAAVEPGAAVRRYLRWEAPGQLRVGPALWILEPAERVVVLAVGKAAAAMAAAAVEVLGPFLADGMVVTKKGHAAGVSLPPTIEVWETGHPIPDAAGLAAAGAMLRRLDGLGAQERVLVLLSGGTSALLPCPLPGLTLADLQVVTDLLLRSGATIGELNATRKHLDGLKGGRLAQRVGAHPLATLILSDVVGDPVDVIASGPTVGDPTTYAEVQALLVRRGVLHQVPPAVQALLAAGAAGQVLESLKPDDPLLARAVHCVIGSNRLAALAAAEAAERLGYRALSLGSFMEGEAREVGRLAAGLVKGVQSQGQPLSAPACLIWGGETTVTVRGSGKGGRNQELALSAALALEGRPGFLLMALATDGTDGPTDAAGAVIDGETVRRARRLGLEPEAALANHDAYPLLEAVGALMKMGPTGTNVNDLLIVLVHK